MALPDAPRGNPQTVRGNVVSREDEWYETSESWRRATVAWQRWANNLLKRLGELPPGFAHGDRVAREIIAHWAMKARTSKGRP
jgi:hypothetical protein